MALVTRSKRVQGPDSDLGTVIPPMISPRRSIRVSSYDLLHFVRLGGREVVVRSTTIISKGEETFDVGAEVTVGVSEQFSVAGRTFAVTKLLIDGAELCEVETGVASLRHAS